MATVIDLAGRALITPILIQGGIGEVREPGTRVELARKAGVPYPEIAVRANGAAMTVGGIALALGVVRRPAALLLAATLLGPTYAGHAYWNEADPQKRRAQRTQFMKNISLIGGLLLEAARRDD